MHLEILVEDLSGKKALEILVPKIIGDGHTYKVISYKGIGRIPQKMGHNENARNRILLDQLPRILSGYGNAFSNYPSNCPAAVLVVCDLDDKCQKRFREELMTLLNNCEPKPDARFCFAIEEGEAWFLGDLTAIKKAFPKAKEAVLKNYRNDSICGTWECLADALFKGGAKALAKRGWQAVGAEKSSWATRIPKHMDIETNRSPSFRYFKGQLKELTS